MVVAAELPAPLPVPRSCCCGSVPVRRNGRFGCGSVAIGLFLHRNGRERGSGALRAQAQQQQQQQRSALGMRWASQPRPDEGLKGPFGCSEVKDLFWDNVQNPRPQRHGCKSVIPFSARNENKGLEAGSCPKKHRRTLLLSSIGLVIGLTDIYAVAVPLRQSESGTALSATLDSPGAILNKAESRSSEPEQQQAVNEDVKSWYRYRGEGFVLRIPPGYEDILDPGEEEVQDSSKLYGGKAKEKPFAALFASPDRDEMLSIVVKRASQLRLSFFEVKDISDFGNIKDAAATFVPAGAKLVSARVINSKASRIPRTYYVYEFVVRGTHFSVTAGVSKGRVFLLGASAPQAKWKDYSGRLQLAAATFFLP